MQRTNGSLARHARPLFVVATLVSSIALAFTPGIPTAIALSPSPEPSASVDPSPSPAPDPAPDPTADPSTDPNADPTPAPTPGLESTPVPEEAAPSPEPEPTTTVAPDSGPAPDQPSPAPRAIELDASRGQYGRVADDPAFHLPVFTVETWFRRDVPAPGDPAGMSGTATTTGIAPGADAPSGSLPPGADQDAGGLVSVIPLVTRGDGRDTAGRLGWFVGLDAETAVLVADLQDVDGGHHPVLGTTVLEAGTWYHVAATCDGTSWRIYLNGRLEAEVALDGAAPATTGTAPVGLGTAISGDGASTRGSFDGDLDETRIWSNALTGAEIRAGLDRPVDGTTPRLVAAWSMDEPAGDTLADVSPAHLDAALVGGPARIDSPIPDGSIPDGPRSLTAEGGTARVRLDWAVVHADDLAGYNVYRSGSGPVDTDGEPLNGPVPIAATGYLDTAVEAGGSYRYVVTAVDRFGNESPPSDEVAATVDAPPSPDASPSPDVEPSPSPSAVPSADDAPFTLTSDAPGDGRHRIDPGSTFTATVTLRVPSDASRADLSLSIPDGWTVVDGDGGIVDAVRGRISWLLTSIPPDSEVVHRVGFLAPAVSPIDGGPTVSSTFTAWLEQPDLATAGPSLDILVAPRLVVASPVLGQVDPVTLRATYLPAGTPITDEQRFEAFRLRFQVRNADDLPVAVTPQLEFRAAGARDFSTVPALDGRSGVPFFVGREWTAIPGAGGTELGPVRADIPVAAMLVDARDDPAEVPVTGVRSMGLNPLGTFTVPGRSVTEIEFSVRATAAADYLAGYEFRLTDGGQPMADSASAEVALGRKPLVKPSTVLRDGVPAGEPEAATGAVVYALNAPVAGTAPRAPRYTLVVSRATAGPAATGPATAAGAGSDPAADSPHGSYAATTDACAACHSSHSSRGPALLVKASPESGLCLTCHRDGGSASATDVQAQYADPTVPQNDPATRTFYTHDALAPNSGHTSATDDEFGGVSNRHSECADCHSPHAADATPSVQTASGWTASGRLGQVSGVAVTNSLQPGVAPTYTLIGGPSAPIAFEYQLCFKCHSGYTTLPSNAGFSASRYLLDKGVEFDPKTPSFHPIEQAGTNGTTAMAESLGGPSTYKLWNFTPSSTIRCENCHGDDRTAALALAGSTTLAPGADLAPHANQPGTAADPVPDILIASYRYRVLKAGADPYEAADFALCYTCHSEQPFLDTSGTPRTDTNFPSHGQHVSGIVNRGPAGTDIDTAGDGGGLATCAECHFRIHSTAYPVGGQGSYPRLVNFAPNATAVDSVTDPVGVDAWDPTAKTCTLTCHGQDHRAQGY